MAIGHHGILKIIFGALVGFKVGLGNITSNFVAIA